ncbi:MAG: 3-phosphoshikimate 1-carboxyvinyltransferase, partial [Chrysiogenetes bacterium]|nr:3-phosphoshikimate 1-carboxyvinyltransferase [Chrysiogenetes bacterium]
MKSVRVAPKRGVCGSALVPGDKSISHRSVMLGSIAEGVTEVTGFLAGEDPLATMAAFREMGVEIAHNGTNLTIHGVGLHGLKKPARTLDIGNSGTSIRLMSGLLSGQAFETVIDGDASIRKRPMKRVIEPLSKMGARIEDADGAGHAPLTIRGVAPGQKLQAIKYESPVASAQVKSAILLAGLYADGKTTVREPHPSRDHTERMLAHMGVRLERGDWGASIVGGAQPKAATIDVPADISSAAFFLVAALLAGEGELVLPKVGVNPTRDGIIEALQSMGAKIELENPRELGGEPVADLRVAPGALKGATIGGALIPRLIDEIPALCVAACFAEGT